MVPCCAFATAGAVSATNVTTVDASMRCRLHAWSSVMVSPPRVFRPHVEHAQQQQQQQQQLALSAGLTTRRRRTRPGTPYHCQRENVRAVDLSELGGAYCGGLTCRGDAVWPDRRGTAGFSGVQFS